MVEKGSTDKNTPSFARYKISTMVTMVSPDRPEIVDSLLRAPSKSCVRSSGLDLRYRLLIHRPILWTVHVVHVQMHSMLASKSAREEKLRKRERHTLTVYLLELES